ncbi:N-glycosylase/DNA lyase [Candidatus Omnitrophota bacterium]
MSRRFGLISEYKRKKRHIKQRLREFRGLCKASDKVIFAELCFCLLTPQAKALVCDKAIKELKRKRLLFEGREEDIKPYLRGVRFPNNKARYLVSARNLFKNCKGIKIKDKLDIKELFKTRDWLASNVKGLGYKEASHFLRNIGLGRDMAILDVHILRNLKICKVIKKIPPSLNRKAYLDIEEKMRRFSRKVSIPLEDIDLLFWSSETGFIFK